MGHSGRMLVKVNINASSPLPHTLYPTISTLSWIIASIQYDVVDPVYVVQSPQGLDSVDEDQQPRDILRNFKHVQNVCLRFDRIHMQKGKYPGYFKGLHGEALLCLDGCTADVPSR